MDAIAEDQAGELVEIIGEMTTAEESMKVFGEGIDMFCNTLRRALRRS
jgi:hypothetical protein